MTLKRASGWRHEEIRQVQRHSVKRVIAAVHAMGSPLAISLAIGLCAGLSPAAVAEPRGDQALIQLLQTKACRGCRLADVDLVHAQLRDADLEEAKLQRANLSQAQLDGANLRNANLSFTSLQGASLRGADLRGSRMVGTDLRDVDLTGALINANALEEAHWTGATGLQPQSQSHAALHNAGVTDGEANRWTTAEELFGLAIRKQPDAAESWVARGIAREKLGKRQLAIQDFNYASSLYAAAGGEAQAAQLTAAAQSLQDKVHQRESSNGMGSAVLNGLLSTSKALLPLAMKLFMPTAGF